MIIPTRICSICDVEKRLKQFYIQKTGKYGRSNKCISCAKKISKGHIEENPNYKEKQRDSNLKRNYGIDINDYNKMFLDQEGCCAICKTHQIKLDRKLAVDHCHDTGKVRLLLCSACNTGIGFLKHDIGILANAIKYLTLVR